jgi:formamidopyrimidine-DNA glycosylase
MPELPEVETVRRTVEPHLLGRRIVAATLHRRDVLVAPGDPPGGFSRNRCWRGRPRRVGPGDLLAGTLVTAVRRVGKQLAIVGRGDDGGERAVVVQLGMTGQLVYADAGRRLGEVDHVHATWRVEDGGGGSTRGRLVFRDPRRFGQLRAIPTLGDLAVHWSALGPDALTIAGPALGGALSGSARAVKAALLDQAVLAGVGNIYADESLFEARVAPDRPAGSLTGEEVERLAGAIRRILAAAVAAGGTTLRDYTDADGRPGAYAVDHRVYGRSGGACVVCGALLRTGQLAQRTTVWCPACQR